MPLYSFACDVCRVEWDEFQGRDQKHVSNCPECGIPVKQQFKPFIFKVDFRPGFDPGFGQYVNTKAERENVIARDELKRIKD